MVLNPRTAHDALCDLWDELTMVRAVAQLLLLRLDREPDGYDSQKDACQIIIEQIRLIEQVLERLHVEAMQPHGLRDRAPGQVTDAPDLARAGRRAAGRGPAAGAGQRTGADDAEWIQSRVSGGGPRLGLTNWRATVEIQMEAHGFTPTERRVAWELLQAHINKEIAQTLGVTENTIKNHLTAIFYKTDATSRVGLVMTLLGLTHEQAA